ncbi:protein tyrosine phosphatase [Serratia fonticola]|uniref:arsenate reductase/protein-tyrosine-phosphatase family protein n=1 Tax=Serratia TaxID=613 RepID=UPI000BFCF077|nr:MULTISPECIES: protein tyrosine phosphatase [Serratia]ATM74548.1 protein tyrosine phosphatase [Serratia fonticola]MBL5859063.1 protein tyrosine phosphatase [Serratia fonticola]HEJ9058296.1 protein tyrosine phosphatase [Serratia fonticola]
MFDSILVVCVGNICRSPMGERLLLKHLPNKRIESAGISAVVGNPADKVATSVALEHDLSLEGHCGRQLTSSMCREFELILVMEQSHIDSVCQIAPEVRGKTMLFGHWLDKQDISDPYRKSREIFEAVYQLIDRSASLWAKALI